MGKVILAVCAALFLSLSFGCEKDDDKSCDDSSDCAEVTCNCSGATVTARVCDIQQHKCITDCTIICQI